MRKRIGRRMRVAVVEPVAEPQDLRPGGEFRFRQRRDGAFGGAQPGRPTRRRVLGR